MWNQVEQIDYALPVADELPATLVDWTPEAGKCALLVHDMQHYFLRRFKPGAEPHTSLTSNVASLVSIARELNMPIVYTAQNGDMTAEQRGLLHDFWGPGMAATAADREVPAEYAPRQVDAVLPKWRYSAFFKTDLGQIMEREGRTQLIVSGIYAHVGVLATAVESYTRDIQTFLPADAVADFSREEHLQTLDYAAGCCAAVGQTRDLVADLHRSAQILAEPANAGGLR